MVQLLYSMNKDAKPQATYIIYTKGIDQHVIHDIRIQNTYIL